MVGRLSAGLLVWLAIAGTASAVDYSLVPRVAPKLSKVQAATGDGRVAIGTGVMIAADTVVTNCHVTRNAQHVEIWTGGRRFVASRQSADVERDLCVLFASGMPDLVVPIAAGRQPSGGGLFNDRGDLIGIVTFRHRGQSKDAYHFSVPAEWALALRDASRGKEVGALGAEPAFWQRALDRQPFFLQAVALEAEGRWRDLHGLALGWTPSGGGPWHRVDGARRRLGEARPAGSSGGSRACGRIASRRFERLARSSSRLPRGGREEGRGRSAGGARPPGSPLS